MRNHLTGYILYCLLILTSALPAQQYKLFSYNELDGIQNTLIKATAVDSFGLIWLATDGGLIRYNGNQFISFKESIPTPFVKDILNVGDRLLASTDEGLFWVEPLLQSAVITKAFPGQDLRLTKKLFRDGKGRIWGSNNSLVFCVDGDQLKVYPFDPEHHSEDFTLSFSFAEDGYGHIFTVTKNGALFRFEESADFFSPPLHQFETGANAAINMDDGEIWIATYGGIFQLSVTNQGGIADIQQVSSLGPSAMYRHPNGKAIVSIRNVGLTQIDKSGKETALGNDL